MFSFSLARLCFLVLLVIFVVADAFACVFVRIVARFAASRRGRGRRRRRRRRHRGRGRGRRRRRRRRRGRSSGAVVNARCVRFLVVIVVVASLINIVSRLRCRCQRSRHRRSSQRCSRTGSCRRPWWRLPIVGEELRTKSHSKHQYPTTKKQHPTPKNQNQTQQQRMRLPKRIDRNVGRGT